MRSWSKNIKKADSDSGDSSGKRKSISDVRLPVWVTHSPAPDNITDNDTDSTGRVSCAPSNAGKDTKGRMKGLLKSLIPQSWGSLKNKWTKDTNRTNECETSITKLQILPNGTRVSPPVSPVLDHRNWDAKEESVASSTENSHNPLLRKHSVEDLFYQDPREESVLTSIHPAEYYAEKVEVYKLKYSYLKSWPGLLRLLAGLELLFGGMVFACIIAYIQKDSEWSNTYGLYNGIYNNGLGLSGYSYRGPMTPFVLAVAGISWILTLILLVMGLTMYYRTILLDSSWWPLTEAFVNVTVFLLYMAAGIVYLNDLNRGGLCYMTVGINPIMANLCRVDGGQMAGTAFIFINMVMYLISFVVCLKMWRHEAARRETQNFDNKSQDESPQSIPLKPQNLKQIAFTDEKDGFLSENPVNQQPRVPGANKSLVGARTGFTPKVHVVPDYIIKYPEISCAEEREKYRAVFNDQYQEYKDLHADINASLSKFTQLDAMMARLLREGKHHEDQDRIQRILMTYQQKKNDPAFREKQERRAYLKAKLSHIKNRIRSFDQDAMANVSHEK
ncbi:occludin/ELL domain-containing protein 1 [Thalassophryne amazonica]|uniref:occludin/ELL domain-containing protein 1 n=1 Tax=Thalassophryne amazonica TaxID=390379 RepID=UPI001472040C|nr:occludin/ELL domain-containing protein 1 [Thalassophryne amazonica]XP_034038337.1 occludin/ELL domain-containing protein 1 [Thalassophryne amazonica]